MKTGIISFCNSKDNYGQILQCWALQKTLSRLGHEPFHIRYAPARPSKLQMFKEAGILRSVLFRITHHKEIVTNKKLRAENSLINARRDFDSFIAAHMNMSQSRYETHEQLKEHAPEADAYITGSDQVWSRLPVTDKELPYYLDFGSKDIRRIAYAASFGRDAYPEDNLPLLKMLLKDFDAISVREASGLDICAMAGRRDAESVLDPTLLLKGCDYDILDIPRSSSQPYAFVYSVNVESSDQLDWPAVKQFCKETGYEIKAVSASGNMPGRVLFDEADYLYPQISEWIGLIRDASMVFTSSFHGVVFSLLMHRDFVFYPLSNSYSAGNGRVRSLLKILSLEGHIWEEGFRYEELKQPDWSRIDAILEHERMESLRFLIDNLK